jgi:hypothetical protein
LLLELPGGRVDAAADRRVVVVVSAIAASALTFRVLARGVPAQADAVGSSGGDAEPAPDAPRTERAGASPGPAIDAGDRSAAPDAAAVPASAAPQSEADRLAAARECVAQRDQRCCVMALAGVEPSREVRAMLARCRALTKQRPAAGPGGGPEAPTPGTKAPIVRDLPE